MRTKLTLAALTMTGVLLAACAPAGGPPAGGTAPGGSTPGSVAQASGSSSTVSGPRTTAAGTAHAPSAPVSATLSATTGVPLAEQLRQAAWHNDVPAARALIAQGADVNAKDGTQQSAYLIATSEGYQELLELTLAHGGNVHDLDSWQGTGLIRAAERGHAGVVGVLLRAGIPRDHVNRIGYQAIHEAIWLGRPTERYADTVRVLTAGGVQLDRPSGSENLTPLAMAQQKGFTDMASTVQRALNGPHHHDLLAAAAEGDADGVALALRAGADIETRDTNGRTALLLAAAADHLAVARLLVALGANVNALDNISDTPWLVTGVTGSVAMLEALLPGKPDLTLRNRFGGISLIPAAERGHVDYVARVLKTGINVNHVNNLGWTALLEAVILGDGSQRYQRIVTHLLAAGADPNVADRNGITAAEHARRAGHNQILALLTAPR